MNYTNKSRFPPWTKWLGIGLIGLSGVLFAALLLVPFTPFSLPIKGGLALLFLILMEVCFWLGTLIIGKQVISRYWKSLKSRFGFRGKGK
jgi:hypothetical protein